MADFSNNVSAVYNYTMRSISCFFYYYYHDLSQSFTVFKDECVFTLHQILSQYSIANFSETSKLSISSETLTFTAVSMMILVSLCKEFSAKYSSVVIFDLSGLDFSSACYIFHHSLSSWAFDSLNAIPSFGDILIKCGTNVIVLAKLKPLFSTDSSEELKYRQLKLATVLT